MRFKSAQEDRVIDRLRAQEWWDRWFLGLARYVSTASKDPSTQCGAVIVDGQRRVVSTGYNGFPRGIRDDARLMDRGQKYEMVVHAEANALLFAQRGVRHCTVYTWPTMTCSRCASLLVQAGITRHVAPVEDDFDRSLRMQHQIALKTLREAGVVCGFYNIEEGRDKDATKNEASKEAEGQERSKSIFELHVDAEEAWAAPEVYGRRVDHLFEGFSQEFLLSEGGDAVKEGIIQQGREREHQNGNGSRETPKAGGSDSVEQGGEEKEKAPGEEGWGQPVNRKRVESLDGRCYEKAEVWRELKKGT